MSEDTILRTALYIVISIGLYYWLKQVIGNKDVNVEDPKNIRLVFISVAIFFCLSWGTTYLGTTIPGDFFERSNYEGIYYVYLFPDDNEVKCYKVPATIEAKMESSDSDDEEGSSSSSREYRIQSALMPNGGSITFQDDNLVYLNKKEHIIDSTGRMWTAQLSNERHSENERKPYSSYLRTIE